MPSINNPHSNDDSFGLIGGQFHVVGWPKAAIGHLHYPSLGVRGGGSRLGHLGPPCYGPGFAMVWVLLLPFPSPLGPGAGIATPAPLAPPAPGPHAPLRPVHAGPRPGQDVPVPGPAVRPGPAPPPGAFSSVSCLRKELAPALARTRIPSCATRSRVTAPAAINEAAICGQQLIQGPLVGHPKVRQHVVVDGHPSTQPPVSIVFLAQARQLPGTAYPFHSAEQPQGQQHFRVRCGAARPVQRRFDGAVEGPTSPTFSNRPQIARAEWSSASAASRSRGRNWSCCRFGWSTRASSGRVGGAGTRSSVGGSSNSVGSVILPHPNTYFHYYLLYQLAVRDLGDVFIHTL